MSIEKAWTGWEGSALHIRCDRCGELLDTGQHTEDEAYDVAADADWSLTDTDDLCPTCTRDQLLAVLNAALATVPTE